MESTFDRESWQKCLQKYRLTPPREPINHCEAIPETVLVSQRTNYVEMDCVNAVGGPREHACLCPHMSCSLALLAYDTLSVIVIVIVMLCSDANK